MNLKRFKKTIAILLSFITVSNNNLLFAAVLPYMPPVGQLTLSGTAYDLPRLVGMRFASDDPFRFTFILNAGNNKAGEGLLRREIAKIDKYFLAALTLPADELWVNLSPYENNRISTDALAATDLGKDLLGEDYVLKQLAASLTYPETKSGKQYWNAVNNVGANNYSPAHQNFNKVWIVPGKIKILESKTQAVIKEAVFKVMVDEDYLAMQKNQHVIASVAKQSQSGIATPHNSSARNDATNAFRQYILPLIEKEVNTGERFSALRQAYSAMVMAVWFKEKLKKTILNDYYLNKKKLNGAQADDPAIREKIYNEYVAAFNKGVYNYVKKEAVGANPAGAGQVNYSPVKKIMKRAYFSGGVGLETLPAEVSGGATVVSESEEAAALWDVAAAIEADRVLAPLLPEAAGISPAQKKADLEGAVQYIMAQKPRQATPIFQRYLIGGPRGSNGAFRHVKEGMAQRITNALKEQAFLGWPESDLISLAEIFIDRANLYLQDTSRKMPAFLEIAKRIDNLYPAVYSRRQAMTILNTLAVAPYEKPGATQNGSPTGGFDFTRSASQDIETHGMGLKFSSREAKAELAKMSGMHLETLALRY